MNNLFIALIIILCVAILFVKGYLDNKKENIKYLEEYEKNFGVSVAHKFSKDELSCISQYFYIQKGEEINIIDDITWNDLDMDTVFSYIDKTQSQAGSEVLYKMLRLPADEDTLNKREELIQYFSEDKASRDALIMQLKELGRFGDFSFISYIDQLSPDSKINISFHIACLVFAIVSMASVFINPPVGFVLMIVSLIFNIVTYFKEQDMTKSYILTFSYIIKELDFAKRISGLKIDKIRDELKEIEDIAKNLVSIKRGSGLVLKNNKSTGNFADLFLDYLRMYLHLDYLVFNRMLTLACKNKESYIKLWEMSGNLDALIAVAAYRKSLPFYCTPEFGFEDYSVKDLYHPLLTDPVANSFENEKGMLITGSNASGKSTFLRAVALNALLSQTIHTSVSGKYHAPQFMIMTSMALSDNIESNDSYYMAEIKSLKRILDKRNSGYRMLCCIDEILRGTNTAERIAAAASVLEFISKSGIICFAATHDLELATLLGDLYDNFHFGEIICEDKISFPYKLEAGVTKTRNAIKLLSFMGFENSVVEDADLRCRNFLENKIWT